MSEGSTHTTSVSVVKTAPAEIDAGTDLALKVRVACSSACDLRGNTIRIIAQGAVVKEMAVELTEFDGEAAETDEFVAKAPIKQGEYTWTVLFPALEIDGVQHGPSSATITVSARAHQIFMSVWDVASPIGTGQTFAAKIGAKCSAGCSLANLPYVIQDNSDNVVATGKLWTEELEKTRDLYWAEQELGAPAEEGLYEWTAKAVTSDLRLPHEVTPMQFPFFAARPPDYVATVQVVDKSQNRPVKNASIFLDRRRATTDEHGIAKIEVTKGTHELYVAKRHYQAFQMTVQIDGDVTINADLVFEPDIMISASDDIE